MNSINYNIVLCGFMGCGKSTVGKMLSQKLGIPFIDMDSCIENKYSMKIKQIFEKYGEEYFRYIEYNEAKEASNLQGCVISTGGGTLMYKRNIDVLKPKSKVVFLNVPFNIIESRLRGDTSRPLFCYNNIKNIKELFEKRLKTYYMAADLVIDASSTAQNVCNMIIDSLY